MSTVSASRPNQPAEENPAGAADCGPIVRRGRSRIYREDSSHAGQSWLIAIATFFLTVGVNGAFRPAADVPLHFSGLVPAGDEEVPIEDISMADLPAEELVESTETETIPETELPPETAEQEEPEPEPILKEEDVFKVPAPPPVEQMLKPVDPRPVEQKPRPQPTVRPPSGKPSRPAATAPGGSGQGGGGGTATAPGTGRGKFPKPPYPAFARSRGLGGTVTLSISVNPAGGVSAVSVVGSTGSSQLDEHAVSWVRRHWQWPTGGQRQFRLPVNFRLR